MYKNLNDFSFHFIVNFSFNSLIFHQKIESTRLVNFLQPNMIDFEIFFLCSLIFFDQSR